LNIPTILKVSTKKANYAHNESDMKFTIITLFIFILMAGIILTAFPQEDKGIEGIWGGTLSVSGQKLRIVFKISLEDDGSYKATMDSPDQGAVDILVSSVRLDRDRIVLELQIANAVFEGSIDPEKEKIGGEWKQGGLTLPLNLERTEEKPELKRPQHPEPPYPYKEEGVIYRNDKAGVILAGTLTYPQKGGPFPAVLLITGSGPQDRNETVAGHKLFLVIADYLTRQGLAVLRVDDRGVGSSTGNLTDSTSEDLAGDVLAGVEFLKSHGKIDGKKIGLLGHSEGGVIAPIAASRSEDVAFIVLLAGTGITGEEILYAQAALIAEASGVSQKDIDQNMATQKKMFEVLKKEKNPEAAEEQLRSILEESFASLDEKTQQSMGDNIEARIQSEIDQVNNRWWRFFLTYDPTTALRKVKCPVLALNGKKDLQVPYQQNLQAIEGGLRSGGNKDFTTKTFSDLNHLFQHAETGLPAEYATIEETISPAVLELISGWILDRIK
jgi:pimeloyl-ACP methyl ester carboxylesterase